MFAFVWLFCYRRQCDRIRNNKQTLFVHYRIYLLVSLRKKNNIIYLIVYCL